jgi:hypothetical protein
MGTENNENYGTPDPNLIVKYSVFLPITQDFAIEMQCNETAGLIMERKKDGRNPNLETFYELFTPQTNDWTLTVRADARHPDIKEKDLERLSKEK